MLGMADALRLVDARVAREQVAHHAGQAREHADLRAEDFHGHQRAGDRRVGRAGEHRHEPEGRQHAERKMQQGRERVAQRRADVEQRRHLAALEAAAQRRDRQRQLGGPFPRRRRLLERLDDGRDAQAAVAPGAAEPDDGRDHQAANQRPRGRVGDVLFHEGRRGVRGVREQHADEAEHHARDDHRREAPEPDRHQHARGVVGVMHAPERRDGIGDDRGDQARQQRVVAKASDHQDLEPEDGARERRAEDRREPRADACHQQDPPVFLAHLQDMRELVRERAAHLHRGAFAADRRAEQMRDDRAHQDERRHPQRHDLPGIVHLVDQQVVARLDAVAHLHVDPADHRARQRQAPDQPMIGVAGLGGQFERAQEQRGSRPRQDGDADGQQQPSRQVRQQVEVFGESFFALHQGPAVGARHLVDEGSRRDPTRPGSPRTM